MNNQRQLLPIVISDRDIPVLDDELSSGNDFDLVDGYGERAMNPYKLRGR
jgi:hypothetical protein